MKKIIKSLFSITLILSSIFIFNFDAKINAQITETLVVEALPSRAHTDAATLYRGELHTRELIPYIVPAGTEVKVRQISGLNKTDIRIQALNNASSTEKNYDISKNGSEMTFIVEYESVLFARIPRGNYTVELEYSFSEDLNKVPYYSMGDNEEEFFNYWDSIDASYAVIECEAIKFLIPKADKEYLRNLDSKGHFDNLDGLLQYYTDLIDRYDYLLGLEDNPENPVHYNTPSQFFAKANNDGPGLAYYGVLETAMSSTSFGYRYLSIGWVEKHEVGHGYQQNSMMDKRSEFSNSISVREVWNNIFAHNSRIDDMWNGDNVYSSSRMTVENLQGVAKTGYDNGNSTTMLNFFAGMFDSFGYEGFRGFNLEFRELANQGGNKHLEYSNSDLMALYFSKYSEVNFVPHFEASHINITTEIEENPDIRDLSYAQYLNYIIEDDAKRQEVAASLNLQADYQMIDTSLLRDDQFSNLDLKSDVNINVNIDDLNEILYKKIILKNGTYELEKEIFSNEVIFEDVPAGVYRILVPNSESGTYFSNSDKLLTVTESGEASFEVVYEKDASNDGTIDSENTIYLRGLSNYRFADVITSSDNIRINILNRAPHVYYSGEEFANVKIYDNQNSVIFEKSFIGDIALDAEVIDIPIEEGYYLEITAAEPNRSDGSNNHTNLNIYSKSSPYVMSFDSSGTHVNGENILPDIIDGYAESIESGVTQFYHQDQIIYLNKMISKLDETDREEKMEQHKNTTQLSRPIFMNVEDSYEVEMQRTRNTTSINDIVSQVTASDFEDGDISSNITVLDHNVNFTTVGSYVINLRVEDSDKNANYVELVVNVIDSSIEPEPPTNSLVDDSVSTNHTIPKTGMKNYSIVLLIMSVGFIVLRKRNS
ncbi:MAG: putative mucin/carbohydrate-binding domain-containing protein [Bacilli bacterium]